MEITFKYQLKTPDELLGYFRPNFWVFSMLYQRLSEQFFLYCARLRLNVKTKTWFEKY